MIQRIQSLLLLIAAAAATVLTLINIPFASKTSATVVNTIGSTAILSGQTENATKIMLVEQIGAWAAVALGSLLSIFLYKNLKLQAKATQLIALISLLAIALPISKTYLSKLDSSISINTSAILFIVPFFCTVLALRFVKKDQKLLASINRLR